jgi:hypothetical protein
MILIENYNGEFLLIHDDELEFDGEENFYEYWDNQWKRIFVKNPEEDFKYIEIEVLQECGVTGVTLCKEEEGDYFLLLWSDTTSPDRVFFKDTVPLEEFVDHYKDYINHY